MTEPAPRSEAPAAPDRRKWIVALSVTFGTLMGAIDASIVNVALSQIRGAVGATVQEITWISTGFAIATVLVMPLTGFLGRMFGQKRVYLVCLALFILGSGLCGIAWSLPSLVLFRVLQGFGAGALQPTEQAILRQTFPPHEQGTAMALFSMAVMVGPALGPTLGGYIVDHYHWSWIFFINLPIGALGFFMVQRFVHEPEDLKAQMRAEAELQRRNMDWLGIALLWTTLIAMQYVFEEGQGEGWFESPLIVCFTVVSVFGAAMFVVRELTAPVQAVRLQLFADRVFLTGVASSAAIFSVLISGMFLLPLFMQELLGFTATSSGFALMPRTLVMLFAMPLVGKYYQRFPPALFAGIGLAFAAYGQFRLSTLTLSSTSADIVGGIMLQGVGMSMMLVPMNTIALSNVPRHQLGDATGLNSLLRQIGGSMGLAIFVSLLSRSGAVARESMRAALIEQRPEVAGRLAAIQAAMQARGASPGEARELAVRSLGGIAALQGTVIAFERLFAIGALLFVAVTPLVLMLRAPRRPPVAPMSPGAAPAPPEPAPHVEIEV